MTNRDNKLALLRLAERVKGADANGDTLPERILEEDLPLAEIVSDLLDRRIEEDPKHQRHAAETNFEAWSALAQGSMDEDDPTRAHRLRHLARICLICAEEREEASKGLRKLVEAERLVNEETLAHFRQMLYEAQASPTNQGHEANLPSHKEGGPQALLSQGKARSISGSALITRLFEGVTWLCSPRGLVVGVVLATLLIGLNLADPGVSPGLKVERMGGGGGSLSLTAQVIQPARGETRAQQLALLRVTDGAPRPCPPGAGLRLTIEPLGDGYLNLWMVEAGGGAQHLDLSGPSHFSGSPYVFPPLGEGADGREDELISIPEGQGLVEIVAVLSLEAPPGVDTSEPNSIEAFITQLFNDADDQVKAVSPETLRWIDGIQSAPGKNQVDWVQCRR